MPSPATFKVSASKQFALLVNSTGALCVVWSKQYAHFMIKEGVRLKVIKPDDIRRLRELVNGSEIEPLDANVPQALKERITELTLLQVEVGPDVELSEEFILREMESIEKQLAAAAN